MLMRKLYNTDRLMPFNNGLCTTVFSGAAPNSIGSAARRPRTWRIADEAAQNRITTQTALSPWQRCEAYAPVATHWRVASAVMYWRGFVDAEPEGHIFMLVATLR